LRIAHDALPPIFIAGRHSAGADERLLPEGDVGGPDDCTPATDARFRAAPA
jgi:hypothetical protein